jgi:hypothetical protein
MAKRKKSVISGEPMKSQNIGKNQWLYNLECCDCGLQHLFIFEKHKNKLLLFAYKDEFETKLNKKHNG